MKPARHEMNPGQTTRRWLMVLFAMLTAATLVACGSTKVYTADKTVVYKDSVYNVSNVTVFTVKNVAVLEDQSTVDLSGMEKKEFEKLLDQQSPVFVRQYFQLDDKEMVYQARNVDKYSDLSSMNKKFKSASSSLTKFLADKKKTQLKLK